MKFYKRFLLSLSIPLSIIIAGVVNFHDPITNEIIYTTDGVQNIALPDQQYYPLLIILSLILAFNLSFFFLRFTSSFFNRNRGKN